ncbi:hypothetical protein Dimus_035766 [Dionaea muscipula]
MREGLGSGVMDLLPDLTASAVVRIPSKELAPIAIPEPVLRASSEGLTMADSQTTQIPSDSDGSRGFEVDLASDPVALGHDVTGHLREVSGLEGAKRASPANAEGAVAMKQLPLSPLADALVLVCEGDGDAVGPFYGGSAVAAIAVQGKYGSEGLIDDGVVSQPSGNCRLGRLLPVLEQEVDGGFGGASMLIPMGDGGEHMVENGVGSDAMMNTTDNVCSSMTLLLVSTVDTIVVGFVREEV